MRVFMSLVVLSAFMVWSSVASRCGAGQTHIKLQDTHALPTTCLPPMDDLTGQAVFECTRSWNVVYADCQVRLSPVLPASATGLPCHFFTSRGNITGPHTAHIQAEVDTRALLRYLQQHPDVAARLSANNSPAPSYPELTENLALVLRNILSHRPLATSTPLAHTPLPTPSPATTTGSATATATAAAVAQPHTITYAPKPHNPARRLLAAHLPLQDGARASQQHHISTAAEHSSSSHAGLPAMSAQELLNQGGSQHVVRAAGAHRGQAAGDTPAEGSLVVRKGAHIEATSANDCVFVYTVKPKSDFLAQLPPPPIPAGGGWATVVACLGGAAMIGISVAWFAAAQFFAARQDEIAEQLLQQQAAEQRATTAAMIAAARCRRLARHSCSSASSESSGGSSGGSTAGDGGIPEGAVAAGTQAA